MGKCRGYVERSPAVLVYRKHPNCFHLTRVSFSYIRVLWSPHPRFIISLYPRLSLVLSAIRIGILSYLDHNCYDHNVTFTCTFQEVIIQQGSLAFTAELFCLVMHEFFTDINLYTQLSRILSFSENLVFKQQVGTIKGKQHYIQYAALHCILVYAHCSHSRLRSFITIRFCEDWIHLLLHTDRSI